MPAKNNYATRNGEGPGEGDLFSRIAKVPPDRSAVIDAARQVSFGELADQVARLGRVLRGLQVGPETLVALCLPRSIELVTSILAILKAGGAYVPLDPEYPEERLTYMMRDSQSRCLITNCAMADAVPWPDGIRRIVLDGPDVISHGQEISADPAIDVQPDNLAYIIYTSGSTGRPKGVEVSRGDVARLLDGLEQSDVVAAKAGRVGWNASISFDASVQQWSRLFRGDTLVLVPAEVRSDPAALAEFARQQRLTDLDITPAHLDLLLEHLWDREHETRAGEALRLLVGGEPISPVLWSALAAAERAGCATAVNLYGPTECVVDSTAGSIADSDQPHLGRPLPGVRAYILDEALRPVADREPGELYIGGVRLARGYRGLPGLTAERFLPDTAAGDGSRMYRTGDRVRRDARGNLEYLGRLDQQVKIRGFRMEPGEIESALRGVPGVVETAVTVRDDLPGGPGLVAYCRVSEHVTSLALRRSLAARLPEFMVPSAFVLLDKFPLNANGKIDRSRLPAPKVTGDRDSDGSEAGFVSPSRPVEKMITDVWSDVLGRQEVSVGDDFFEAGGHSILAIRVVARLKRELNIAIPMAAVFNNPRLRDLADYVEQALAAREHAGRSTGG